MNSIALSAHVFPSGRVALNQVDPKLVSDKIAKRIVSAFAVDSGHGILHLAAMALDTPLDTTMRYWRSLGRIFLAAACSVIDPMKPNDLVLPEPDSGALLKLTSKVPPMLGAEFVDEELLLKLWREIGSALILGVTNFDNGMQGYLEAAHSVWNVAGRVCLHLAENKGDPDYPFAFIATYARHSKDLAGQSTIQYVPLNRALQEYSGTRNKQTLLALLTPLQRAAKDSRRIRALVDSGDIYHALAWTAEEAYEFLGEAEHLKKAGLVVRLPDWWSTRRRPQVSVTVGEAAPVTLGVESLLDFKVGLSLGGETLTRADIATLLKAGSGLVLLKGQWVEVDSDKLSQLLENWQELAEQVEAEGVSFSRAMRMLSGANFDDSDVAVIGEHEWSEVVAGKWLNEKLDALREPKVLGEVEARAGLKATLRPYQVSGVQWLKTLNSLGLGGCLADDMGLGKTIQVIALLSILKKDGQPGTDLLVVPASLVENWRQEIARFAPHLSVLIAHSSQVSSRKLQAMEAPAVMAFDVVITTYGTAKRTQWIQEFPWRVLALDEAQAIKNPGSKQTRAIKTIPAQWRLALTGTPVENKLSDLWSIFDFINPGLLGSAKTFGKQCKAMAKRPGGYEPLRTLVGPYILRRLKTDKSIISDLPDKTEVSAYCLLSKLQAALYTQAVEELSNALAEADGIKRRGIVLAYLMRFKQICNHPSQWLGDKEFVAGDSGKFERLTALCEPIAARQDKALVFTQFRSMVAPLQNHLATCFGKPGLVIHGGTAVKKRQGLVQRFQEDEDVPFMVLSLKAGGTGLNLTAANHVIHFDRWWNPAVENQATDRAFRIGQRKNVLVHKFVCRGTIEERIDELISGKQKLSDEVLSGGSETKLTELSNAELLTMVKLDMKSAVAL